MALIPLYGFLEGDTLGLLLLAQDTDRVGELARRLVTSARLRVEPAEPTRVTWRGRVVDPSLTVAQAGIAALDRLDVSTRGPRG